MFTTIKYVLITAIRDKLFVGLIGAMIAAFILSSFLGSTAIVEEDQMRIAFSASSVRIVMMIGLVVFTCFHVRNSFQNKEIDLILSRPISRSSFVIAYLLGLLFISFLLSVGLMIAFSFMPYVNFDGILYWGASLFCESIVMIAFALFASLILRSAVTAVLLCFGFYITSRMMGFFLHIIDNKAYQHTEFGIDMLIEKSLALVSIVMPRLDLYANSNWLSYGISEETGYYIFIPQTIIYVFLLIMMSIYDIKRKQF